MEDSWLFIWLGIALIFAVAEMASPGSFFLLPFAIGALGAALMALLGLGPLVEWLVFVLVSVGTLAAFRPLARRMDREGGDEGIGSRRLIGQTGIVRREIPEGNRDLGIVEVQHEDWRAESIGGTSIPEGATVRIAEVEGTRVLVALLDPGRASQPAEPAPERSEPGGADPTTPSQGAEQ